jgi:two-component system sensor histidine kinase YesM
MKKLKRAWEKLNLFAQMSTLTALVTLVSLVIVTGLVVAICSDDVSATLSETTLGNLQNNNRILNNQMHTIEARTDVLLGEKDLYAQFSMGLPEHFSELKAVGEKTVQPVLQRLFDSSLVYSAYIYTDAYVFNGNSQGFLPQNTFSQTELYKIARESGGRLRWVPTFDFAQMMLQPRLAGFDLSFGRLVAAVRELNFINLSRTEVNQSRFKILDDLADKPILVIFVLENALKDMYMPLAAYNESSYWILSRDGQTVSTSAGEASPAQEVPENLMGLYGSSGIATRMIGGVESIVCYDTLESPGWLTAVVIPKGEILGTSQAKLTRLSLGTLLAVLAATIVLCLLISYQFSHPLIKMKKAVQRIGSGRFDTHVEVSANNELNALASGINEMTGQLQTLIHENYESKLHEKESQLQALNLQINPHFLYNVLNTINYMALEEGNDEISEILVSLSDMLHYAIHYKGDCATLKVETDWLDNYTRIMTMRYDGKISFEKDIPRELDNCVVPKLFLQPIVENAYQHGCAKKGSGTIALRGFRQEENLVFTVTDDGVGMTREQIDTVIHKKGDMSIGLHNVISRLNYLYGDDFEFTIDSAPGRGTLVCIKLPYREK